MNFIPRRPVNLRGNSKPSLTRLQTIRQASIDRAARQKQKQEQVRTDCSSGMCTQLLQACLKSNTLFAHLGGQPYHTRRGL